MLKKQFKGLVEMNRLAHAYLFEGDGFSFAMWMTKLLFCKDSKSEPCNECSSCRRIDHLNHPDVHIIEPDGTMIKIDQVRLLHKEAAYKGVEGSRQVFIIKGAEKLNAQASNALLKFLEEPSQDTLAILIADKKDNILPTILSRVQAIRMPAAPNLERAARAKGYNQMKYLPILSTVLQKVEDLEEIGEISDEYVEIVKSTFEQDFSASLLSVQTTWAEYFSDKKLQLLSIRLIQSYVKALWLAKQKKQNAWQLHSTNLSWDELIRLQNAADELQRGFYSNQHYLLGLETFFINKPAA